MARTPAPANVVIQYGFKWPRLPRVPAGTDPDRLQAIAIERLILGNYAMFKRRGAQLMPWEEHFMRLVSYIWDRPDSNPNFRFLWNPYAMRMLRGVSVYNNLAVAGHASSGKSDFFSVYAICRFLIGEEPPFPEGAVIDDEKRFAKPDNVKVFVTSTTLQESRGRIWGRIEGYWKEAARVFGGEKYMEGKLVSSAGKIAHIMPDGSQNKLAGIELVAGGKGHDGEASTKIGFKARRFIVIADELPLLTHSFYETAITNLQANKFAQFIGIGNPTSPFDPFGVVMEPKGGYATVDETMDGWETKNGYCIRFDGEKSPNVVAGREVWPGLLTLEKLEKIRADKGEKSPEYYRMVRGFLSPDGESHAIYSGAEITSTNSQAKVKTWVKTPTKVAFLDPSFSTGGDEAPVCICNVGTYYNPLSMKNVTGIEVVETIDLMKGIDASNKEVDRNTQLVNAFHAACNKHGVEVANRGVDSTGAGDPFATLMAGVMGREFQMVSFGGSASERPVSSTDPRPGNKRFADRVSELWGVGKDLMRGGQIRGLDNATCMQMAARLYRLTGRDVMEVESKKDMRKRTSGKSPDRADAFFGCIEIARRRLGLTPNVRAAVKAKVAGPPTDERWEALVAATSPPKGRGTYTALAPKTIGSSKGWAIAPRARI